MGLFLVIKGAYGDNAVVEKMCSGSALKCGTSLSAAIDQLNHNTSDQHLSEVLTSYIAATDKESVMSQTQELVQPTNTVQPAVYQKPIQAEVVQPQVELKKDENITLTKEEYDTVQAQLKEQTDLKTQVAELKKERNQTILNQVFGNIEDQEVKTKLFEKYNEQASLVKSVYDDINTHILPKAIEAKLNESKNVKKEESKSASVLKPEPKIDKNESVSASIVQTDDLSLSECRSILGL